MPAPPQIKTEQPDAALAGSPGSSLALRLRLWRNRRIASPAFRAAIARIPFLGGMTATNYAASTISACTVPGSNSTCIGAMPSRANRAWSCSTSGLPVVSSFSP